jgi:serine/threonine protein kinase
MVGDSAVGSTVGGYRIISLIARGGMGSVYLAEDARLDRRVALKIPAPELVGDAAFRDRFLRETKLAASLEHQAIVPVIDAGEDKGRLYLVLRYVEGTDLAGLIRDEGPLPAARLVHLLSQIASALDVAHANGLVHRDVKPGNILVGAGDQAYLSDFGLTKRRGGESRLTRTGQFIGTLDYVAPEMIEGHELTGAGDQYSLACVAFEALTGEPPYRRASDAATLYAHLHEAPASLGSTRPEIPDDVNQVLRRGMAKRPNDRFGSCRAFVDALAQALKASKAPAVGRWARWAMVAFVAVVVVGVGVFLLSGRGEEAAVTQETDVSVSPTPSSDLDRLLGRVPPALRSSCERTQPGELHPPTSLASTTCNDGEVIVTYSLFDSTQTMDDWFNQSGEIVQALPGDCSEDRNAHGTYTIDLVPAGGVLCYTEGGSSYIEWTDERVLIYAAASREDLADQDLYLWWADEAGPLQESKDVPELRRIPDGVYTMRITPSDRDDFAASHDFNLLLDWFGRWVLHLESGEYRMDAPAVSQTVAGSYVAAKGDRVVFYVENVFYCGVDYFDTFEWEVMAGSLRLSREGAQECGRRPRGTDLPPWDLHSWKRIG